MKGNRQMRRDAPILPEKLVRRGRRQMQIPKDRLTRRNTFDIIERFHDIKSGRIEV